MLAPRVDDVEMILDEENDQSTPLLGDTTANGAAGKSRGKVAEYLPQADDPSVIRRVLRTLYGHLPAEDVPRIVWVRKLMSLDRWLHTCQIGLTADTMPLFVPVQAARAYCQVCPILLRYFFRCRAVSSMVSRDIYYLFQVL